MNKLMLMGSAALLAMSGAAMAQSTAGEPAPDVAGAAPATTDAPAPVGEAAPQAEPSAPTAPTVAQSTAPAADAAATVPADPAASTADATTPTPAAPAAGPGATTATANADVAAKVSADWAKYDTGGKGKLTPLEFGNWVLAKNGQDVSAQVEKTKTSKKANLPAIKVLNATATEFAKADTDKDKMISPDELTVYLSA